MGDSYSNKYDKVFECAETFTNETIDQSDVEEVKIYTSETRNYTIMVQKSSLITMHTFLNHITYDLQIIKTLIDSIPQTKVVDSLFNPNIHRVLILNNIEFLGINALMTLKKYLQSTTRFLIITTSKPKGLVQSLFNSHGCCVPCQDDTNFLVKKIQELQLVDKETWKIKIEELVSDLCVSKPTATEYNSIKINFLDLWVSNIDFSTFAAYFIKKLIGKTSDHNLQKIVENTAMVDHQLRNPHYHQIFYFTQFFTFIVDTMYP